MFKKVIRVALFILLIVTLSSCKGIKRVDKVTIENSNITKINWDDIINTEEINNSEENTKHNDMEVVVGKKYTFMGLTIVYDSTDIFNEAKVIIRLSNMDYKVTVKEIEGDFAKIDFRGKEGWVLKWYLTNTLKNEIIQIKKEPLEKVISQDCFFYTFPDTNKSYAYELKAGEVVHIMAEYMDWYCVELIEYENKTPVDKWVWKGHTMDLDATDIKEENPFEIGREKYKEELIGFIQNAESIDMLSLGAGDSFAQITGGDIEYFAELIKDTTIAPKPTSENLESTVECELHIVGQGEERSLMLARGHLQYSTSKAWLQNQNCLIFNDTDIYIQIKGLFGIE